MPSAQLNIDLPARYRVLRHVANGGMAAVYAASDEVLGREVAIKVLSPAVAADDSARERFTREARAAARLSDHPNVVTIYDIGETDADPPVAFIVMELLPGGTLHERLRSGEAIPHVLALRWLDQTASALDAAHAESMVHRDVKPANLLLDAQGNLKVADFGIATLASESSLTQTGQVVGTAAYFSPEQALGKPATAASDRYSLAVLAYELLTGRRPFPPGPPAVQALARVDSDPPPATSLAPGLPDGVDEVLANGMAREPADRPATAVAFVERLHDALGPTVTTGVAHPVPVPTEPVKARVPRTPRPAPVAAAAAAIPPPPRSERPAPVAAARRPPRRSRAGLLAGLAALLLLVGVGIAALAGGGGDPKQAAHTPATTATHKRQPKTTKQPTTTAASTAPATTSTPATTQPTSSGAPADAAQIQASAHQLVAGGDYGGAIAQLTPLVQRCDVQITDPCAYAWFDLGYALRRAGDPATAAQVLEHRLQNPDQSATVQSELDAARAEASGGGASAGPGKAKGHGKKSEGD